MTETARPQRKRGRADLSQLKRSEIHAAQIEREVCALRVQGLQFNEINEKLGITTSYMIFARAMKDAQETREEARALEMHRLDKLQQAVWAAATTPIVPGEEHSPPDIDAHKQALKVIESRRRMLGLDHSDGIAEEQLRVNQETARMLAVAVATAMESIGLGDKVAEVLPLVGRELQVQGDLKEVL